MDFRDVSDEIARTAQGYHYAKTPAVVESLRDKLVEILRALNDFFHQLFQQRGAATDSRSLSTLLLFVVCAVGLVTLILAVYWLIKRASVSAVANSESKRGATHMEPLLDAAGWRKQAEQLAIQQQYRPACRALYLSLLQDMDEHEIADFAPTKTNFEYGYALAKYPQLQSAFKELANIVEVIWFGNKEAGREDYERALAYSQRLSADIEAVRYDLPVPQVRS